MLIWQLVLLGIDLALGTHLPRCAEDTRGTKLLSVYFLYLDGGPLVHIRGLYVGASDRPDSLVEVVWL